VIPTAWVLAAEARWKPDGAHGLSMTAMALDPAGGGRDSAELARRHGGWYAELISAKGQETADGSTTAAMVVRYRLDSAPVIVDVGGGYGGGVTIRLKDNGIEPVSFVSSWESIERTKDGQLASGFERRKLLKSSGRTKESRASEGAPFMRFSVKLAARRNDLRSHCS
jgi:hypothetical protein